ncbi:GntR family transcriptional regulator [[Erwinia] mediterraneensis]|uniref:GntR family transcriptional regulator n=1 Tax=[Erwinia] mediterraneensis TaxID=2161819 RepID=UPI00102F774C|nr:GntR family transcriptional regulator [[Erwinia] mediterraneensis]
MSSDKLLIDWSAKKILRPQSLSQLLADHIRDLIVNCKIAPGSLISENDIATQLNVSRTPVRAALQKLEMERLVQVIPQRGTFVFSFNAQEMQQTSEVRQILEAGALTLALRHDRQSLISLLERHLQWGREALERAPEDYREADTAFHMAIIESSQNRDLIDFYQTNINRIRAFLNHLSRTREELESSQNDHESIVELLRKEQDNEALEKLNWHLGGIQRIFQEKFGE